MHEALVDVETFELAQRVLCIKQRENVQHYDNIYAGYLACSDCGSGLSYKYTKGSSGRLFESFVCTRYRSKASAGQGRDCTTHYVSEPLLSDTALTSVRRFAAAAKAHEDDFAAYAAQLAQSGSEKSTQQAKAEVARLQKRSTELDTIIGRMYEDYALGTISSERYQAMSAKYEQEQTGLRERLKALEQALSTQADQLEGSLRFLQAVSRYTDVTEVTRPLLAELVNKIVVHEGSGKGKERRQRIDIHYRMNGLIDQNQHGIVRWIK